VLLDLDLGPQSMNGIATLRVLRQLPGLAEVPVVFLTAVNDPAVEAELGALGVRDVVLKPFRPRPLVAAIGRVLTGKES
jgi:two-component system, OmpR family, response regulator